MRLVLEDIHGNSKVADIGGWTWGKRITIIPKTYGESREHFSELYNFFTQSLGPGVDIQTLDTLYPRPPTSWTYQIESQIGQHHFFVKNRKDLDWFLLKYRDALTRWS